MLEGLGSRIDDLVSYVDGDVSSIGLAVPRILEAASGTGVVAANLPWRHMPLGAIVRDRTGIRTVVSDDADGAALADKWFGLAQGCRRYVYLGTVVTPSHGPVARQRPVERASDCFYEEVDCDSSSLS